MLFSGRLPLDMRLVFVAISISAAVLVHLSGWDIVIARDIHTLGILGSFIVGAFYTFGLTTPTALVLIVEIMNMNNAILTVVSAAFSAAMVDVFFFMLLRNQLEKSAGRLLDSIHKKLGRFRAAFPIIGFFIFGLPLPDELGLALMGITEIRPRSMFVLIFSAKAITLLMVYWAVKIF